MASVSDIFAAFRGPAVVGRAIGKPTEHAVQMKRRGSIPVAYWPALVAYADEHGIPGIDFNALVAAHAPTAQHAAPAPEQREVA